MASITSVASGVAPSSAQAPTDNLCHDASCPVTAHHEAGPYNLQALPADAQARETNKLPVAVAHAISSILGISKSSFREITAKE